MKYCYRQLVLRRRIGRVSAPLTVWQAKVVIPTRGHPRSIAGNARTILNLVSSGRLRLAELISHRLPASQIGAGYDGLLNQPDHYWGVALDWR